MNYKKILTLALLGTTMLLASSCAKEYADEIATSDKNVADLKQTDIELRKMIETGFATLNQQLNQALSDTEKEKRAAIKKKVEEWTLHMNDMITRMETLTNDEIKKLTKKLDAQVAAIEGKIENFQKHNNDQMDKMEKAIQKAKEDGDKATLAKLEGLKKRLKDADANMDALHQKMDTWQGKLNTIASKDYSATYTELLTRIQALNDIDMERRYQNMQNMLKALTISQYEALTREDLNTINGFIRRISRLYSDIYQRHDDIESDLENWASTAENECGDLESLTNDLSGIDLHEVEEVFNEYEGYDEKVSDVETWADNFLNFIDEVQSAVDEVESKIDEASGVADEIEQMAANLEVGELHEYYDQIDQIGSDLADAMNQKIQELADAYPHAWGGSPPEVTW